MVGKGRAIKEQLLQAGIMLFDGPLKDDVDIDGVCSAPAILQEKNLESIWRERISDEIDKRERGCVCVDMLECQVVLKRTIRTRRLAVEVNIDWGWLKLLS